MPSLMSIPQKQYSLWLDAYTEPPDLCCALLSVPADLPDDLQDILLHSFHIQSALYHFAATRSTGMNLTLPYPDFILSQWAAFFEHMTVLSFGETEVFLDLSRPKPGILDLFRQCALENLPHPLIGESMRTLAQRGKIPLRTKWAFMAYTGGKTAPESADNLLTAALSHTPNKGAFEIPAYLTQEQIEGNPLFEAIYAESDQLMFIGHMEGERFISHAALSFYTHPSQDMTPYRMALQSSRVMGQSLVSTSSITNCYVWRDIGEEEK